MKNLLMAFCLFPLTVFSQEIKEINYIDIKEDTNLKVPVWTCVNSLGQFIVNSDYVIFQTCQLQKKIKVDMPSFKIIEKGLAIDKNTIYLGDKTLKIATNDFQYIGSQSKDKPSYFFKIKDKVYYNLELLDKAHTASFEFIPNSPFAKDKNTIYYASSEQVNLIPISNLQTSDFYYLEKDYFHNGKYVFKGNEILEYKGEKLMYLSPYFGRTKNELLYINYAKNELKPRVSLDLNTLKVLSAEYVQDKNGIHYFDIQKEDFFNLNISKIELENARIVKNQQFTFLATNQNIYFRGNIAGCPNMEVKLFSTIEDSRYFTDNTNIYVFDFGKKTFAKVDFAKVDLKDIKLVSVPDLYNKSLYALLMGNQIHFPNGILQKNLSAEQIKAILAGNFVANENGFSIVDKLLEEYGRLYVVNNELYTIKGKTGLAADKWKNLVEDYYTYMGKLYRFQPYFSVFNPEDFSMMELGGFFSLNKPYDASFKVLPYYNENYLIMDKTMLYYSAFDTLYQKLINPEGLEILAYFSIDTGYKFANRMEVYFLVKNKEGYTLLGKSGDEFTKRFLGKTLSKDWIDEANIFTLQK